MTFTFYFLLLSSIFLFFDLVNSSVKYETNAGIVAGKLNVHLVPHSHDDVGWLKTINQYYIGLNNTIQDACVENVLDSVVGSMCRDHGRKFIVSEQAFFHMWWKDQTAHTRKEVKKLVNSEQLVFVNGGWVMHDEATCHYIDMIDQTTLGHQFIKRVFNKTPTAGWQIDPFGHSAVQSYLLGAELGFDSLHFARIDYQDRVKRYDDKSLEVIWRGSETFGESSQIFANVFPVHYYHPDGFQFEVRNDYVHLQDNPRREGYNVNERVEHFIKAAITQANVTRTNHIMWTMGGDFYYQYAESWFKQMDKLIHYVNKDDRIHALYSTPSIYTQAKNAANVTWPLKLHDYFPYADRKNAYWTGYFTSRPSFKRYVRELSGYYLAARQLEFLMGRRPNGHNTFSLGDALGIAQHHDAVSGTAKQHVTNDYMKRLAAGATETEKMVNSALSCLIDAKSEANCSSTSTSMLFDQCKLLNISYCPPTEQQIPNGKSLVVLIYNPLGWNRKDIIRIPVNDLNLTVEDSMGNIIDAQYVIIDSVTKRLRKFYLEAYTRISTNKVTKYWLVFEASLPPLGWSTYFLSNAASPKGNERRHHLVDNRPINHTSTIEVGPGDLKMFYSKASGTLTRMFNSRTGVDIAIQQNFLWYSSSTGFSTDSEYQASGAYIFRPNRTSPVPSSDTVQMKVFQGPLVDEVHQQFGSWIYQVTRLYKNKDHAEVEWTVGPIPTDDGVGKEVITRIKTDMATNKVFYTDSNGRDFLKRIRDHREDWNLSVNQPVAGNYYPLNLGMYTKDDQYELSVLVDRATGGSSINNGEIELMLHRRTIMDDSRGVEEPLDEQVCVRDKCEGLTARGNYYLNVDKSGAGARWRRTTGQEIYSPPLLAFTHEKLKNWEASYSKRKSFMDPHYSLPPNVALLTLEELEDGSVLLRLAHLLEAGEDVEYSKMAEVELKKLFAGKQITEVKEMSLSANQERSEMKRLQWKVEGDSNKDGIAGPIRGGPVDSSSLKVELAPMEIRTFLLQF